MTRATLRDVATKVGRNDPCPCGSGRKFKHCCQIKDIRGEPSATAPDSRGLTPAQKQRLHALYLETKKHWDAGRWVDTLPAFREIVRLDPDNPDAHHDLGGVLLRCGQPAEAAASLQRAVELRPRYESALRNLVNALEPEGRESEALIACRKLSRIAGDPIDRRYYLAKAVAKEGDREGAEKEVRRVLVVAPRHIGALLLLGMLLSERGMFEEAARHLTAATDRPRAPSSRWPGRSA